MRINLMKKLDENNKLSKKTIVDSIKELNIPEIYPRYEVFEFSKKERSTSFQLKYDSNSDRVEVYTLNRWVEISKLVSTKLGGIPYIRATGEIVIKEIGLHFTKKPTNKEIYTPLSRLRGL